MAFDRLDHRSARHRWSAAAQGERLSHRSAYTVIAIASILGWAIFVAAGVAMARALGLL